MGHRRALDGGRADPTLPSAACTQSPPALCTSVPSPLKYLHWLRPEVPGGPRRSPPSPTRILTLPVPSANHPPFPMKSHPNYLMSTSWLTDQVEQTARTQPGCAWCSRRPRLWGARRSEAGALGLVLLPPAAHRCAAQAAACQQNLFTTCLMCSNIYTFCFSGGGGEKIFEVLVVHFSRLRRGKF